MVPAIPELARLAGDALVILLHLSAALSHLREGNVNAAVTGLTQIVDNAVPGRYVNEAPCASSSLPGSVSAARRTRTSRLSAEVEKIFRTVLDESLHEISKRIDSVSRELQFMKGETEKLGKRVVHLQTFLTQTQDRKRSRKKWHRQN